MTNIITSGDIKPLTKQEKDLINAMFSGQCYVNVNEKVSPQVLNRVYDCLYTASKNISSIINVKITNEDEIIKTVLNIPPIGPTRTATRTPTPTPSPTLTSTPTRTLTPTPTRTVTPTVTYSDVKMVTLAVAPAYGTVGFQVGYAPTHTGPSGVGYYATEPVVIIYTANAGYVVDATTPFTITGSPTVDYSLSASEISFYMPSNDVSVTVNYSATPSLTPTPTIGTPTPTPTTPLCKLYYFMTTSPSGDGVVTYRPCGAVSDTTILISNGDTFCVQNGTTPSVLDPTSYVIALLPAVTCT